MFTRLVLGTILVAAPGWTASAQPAKDDPKTEPKAAAKAEGPLFEVKLADDTQMKVVLLDPSLTVVTKYGKLTIPANEVRRLDFGFRYPEGMEAKIEKAIEELGSLEFRDRETAEQTLAGFGHYVIPALRRALKSENPEVTRRAGSILKLAESKLGSEKGELRDHDVVETAEFTAKGRIEVGVLKVRTKFFGEATVKITDIRMFRGIAGGASSGEFALDAALYAKTNLSGWLETNVEVSSGSQLEVSASGQMDSWPQGPGQYMVSPTGVGGPGAPGGFPGPGGVQRLGSPGQVIGRIGANGNPFIIGANFKGKVNESGRLYLRIAPSQWNCDSTGTYKVKVTVE